MQYVRGPLLILTGAGGGKTSLLVHRIAWLVREYGVDPARIAALAANAHTCSVLRTGIEELLGRKLPALAISTFGEFGLRLIERHPDDLGLCRGFSLYDRTDSEALVEQLLRQDQPPVGITAGAVCAYIAHWKRGLACPTPATDAPAASPRAVAARIYPHYAQRLCAANAIDLDDLTSEAARLLATDVSLLAQSREDVRFLVVDEYEQLGASEHELVRLLAGGGTTLTAAGDDTRTIDDRRSPACGGVARLRTDFPDLRVVRFEHNVRSTGRIAAAARRIAGALSDGPSSYGQTLGAPLQVVRARDEQHEAETVATRLLAHHAQTGTNYQGYAIMFRHMEQALAIERALAAYRIPYCVRGAPSFFDCPEVRDFWAYLRVLCNPADDAAFLRALTTPRRNVDHAALAQLTRFAAASAQPLFECTFDPALAQTLPAEQIARLRDAMEPLRRLMPQREHADAARLARDLIAELHYADWLRDACNDANIARQRMTNVERAIRMIERFARRHPNAGLRSLITPLHLHAILDDEAAEVAADGVTLLTFAAARGREFAHVYIVGFEEGLLPAVQPDDDIDSAPERLLAYRAITCAREGVTFTIAEQRRLAGGVGPRRASRFLTDLRARDVEWIGAAPGRAAAGNILANSATYLQPGTRRSR